MRRKKSRRVKTPNGAGSVIRRSDGRYMARYTATDPQTGLPARRAIYAATEQEVRAKLIQALAARDDGRLALTRGRPMTLSQWAEQWLASRHKRPSTMKTDREVLEHHILPTLGKLRLIDLRPIHIRGVMEAKLAEGKSPRTCNKVREVARKVLNAVNRERPGYLAFNAAELVEPLPQLAVRRSRVLEPDQVHVLLARAREHRDGSFWIFVLATAARLGEGLGLCWEDVDLVDGSVYIRRELQYLKGEWHVLPPKTRKSERPIPLAATASEALRREKEAQAARRERADPAWDAEFGNLVFTTDLGRPLDPSNLRRRLCKVERDLKLPVIGPHQLGRHGCASFLADQNVPPAVAMAILGHANISTTMEIYTHAFPKSMREAAEAIERALTACPDPAGDTAASARGEPL